MLWAVEVGLEFFLEVVGEDDGLKAGGVLVSATTFSGYAHMHSLVFVQRELPVPR